MRILNYLEFRLWGGTANSYVLAAPDSNAFSLEPTPIHPDLHRQARSDLPAHRDALFASAAMFSCRFTTVFVGLFLLRIHYWLSPSTFERVPVTCTSSIGHRVPLPLAIIAARRRARYSQAALIPLTLSDARRRLTPQRPPSTRSIPLSWPYPDSPSPQLVPRTLLTSPLTQRLLGSSHARFLYCPIPGAAAGSLTTHLSKAIGGPLLPLSAFSLRDRERLLSRADVFRFVFVAHPFTRALAAYYRGTRSPEGINSAGYRQFMGHVRGRPLTDQEHEVSVVSLQFYFTFLARQDAHTLHEEFKSQSSLCRLGTFTYDLVGRVEDLAADVQRLDKRLGLGRAVVQADSFFRDAEADATTIFRNPRFRSRVTKLYADDLSHFGYSPTDFR